MLDKLLNKYNLEIVSILKKVNSAELKGLLESCCAPHVKDNFLII